MRRLLRWLSNGLCLLSLLASVGAGRMWWRSYRAADDLFLPVAGYIRYSVRSEAGRVTVFRPPRAPVASGRRADWRAFFARSRLGCDTWSSTGQYGLFPWAEGLPPQAQGVPVAPKDAAADAAGGPLLQALESDDTFAVAHLMLTEGIDRPPFPFPNRVGWCDPAPHGAETMTYNGMVIRCYWTPPPGQVAGGMPEDIFIDPAQRPAIRDYWHRRLRVPARSVAYGWVAAAAAVPLLIGGGTWGRRAWVRRRRRRLGQCASCGYDLTGNTSGKCSECGDAVPAERRVTA